jgi:FkbM family methyltransferase
MGIRHIFRVLARSRSWRFTRDTARAFALARAGVRGQPLAKLRWRDRDVFYRPATSDPLAINQVLLRPGSKAEYYLPPALDPKVILDVGSNIGTSILFLHQQFPAARIYGFEPHPETFRILEKNVGAIPSIKVFNYALGAANGKISLSFDGADFSRFGAKDATSSPLGTITTADCEARHAGEVMKDLGLTSVDLIKIDCEGAEYDVLSALPEEMLRHCRWIVGEMHDATAFDLLALLAPHFDLDLKKRMFVPLFRFHACNLAWTETLRGTFDRNALQL